MNIPNFGYKAKLSLEILPSASINEVVDWAIYVIKYKSKIESIEFDFNNVHIIVDGMSTINGVLKYYYDNSGKEEKK